MSTINRRNLLKTGAGVSAGMYFGAAHAQAAISLNMTSWGAPAEVDAFNQLIAKYKDVKPNVSIRLDIVPSGQYYQQLDTRLAGKQGPDLFRAQYQQIGRYAQSAAAIDVSKYLDAGFGDAFMPSVWQAVSYQGRIHALPHHTDTFALFYNADVLEKLGVEPPKSIDKSWSWAEFIRVAKLMKEKSGFNYPFAMAWQNANAYRWLMYLYQHGGTLLDASLKAPAINNKAGIESIAWTQSWFTEGLVPPNTSLKSTEPTQNLFATGKIGLLLNGDWQIPFIQDQAKFKWGVTYMPRDVAMASDLGGNALAISRDTKNAEAAADFLKFMVNEENMRAFVVKAQLLPVRKSMVEKGVSYDLRPSEMKVFLEQSKTVPEHLVSTVVLPTWGRFNAKLADELELAFTSGQAADATAANIEKHARAMLTT
ncbi:sugar ABC transporter substrate-binding protein [Terrarubrum flagellatum]|uniref:ABC transporter substrate-binding protein n=1 Tax=Terrirubrum flagellatum TaxID=2895980 RepID=UPI00314514B8